MMTKESPYVLSLGIPIIWAVCRRAQSLISFAFVFVLEPVPNVNLKECVLLKYRQKPTPPTPVADAPSKKPQGYLRTGPCPKDLDFLTLKTDGQYNCEK